MNDRDFEQQLDCLYQQSTPRADDVEFVRKLETRWALRRYQRVVVLGGLSAIGATVTGAWLIRTGVAAFVIELLSSWYSAVLPIVVCVLLLPPVLERIKGNR